MQALIRRYVGDIAAGLGLHFLHMSEGPFSHDAGQIYSFGQQSYFILLIYVYLTKQEICAYISHMHYGPNRIMLLFYLLLYAMWRFIGFVKFNCFSSTLNVLAPMRNCMPLNTFSMFAADWEARNC